VGLGIAFLMPSETGDCFDRSRGIKWIRVRFESAEFFRSEGSPFSGLKLFSYFDASDPNSDEFANPIADGFEHAPDLSFFSLCEDDLKTAW